MELPRLKRVITAAVYARYSSEMQASTSARDQVERIKGLAARDQISSRMYPGARIEIAPAWILSDEAVSGKVAGRLGYQAIRDGIRQKAFDILLVDDLSRLTRSLGDLFDLYRLLRHHDVELISISDHVSSADPNAKTLFQVKGMVADLGNDAHSERTMRGLEVRARDLYSTGQKPFGYGSEATRIEKRKGKEVKSHFRIFIVEEQARVVREIFDLYAEGYGKTYIAKTLNGRAAPTPTPRSSGWKDGLIYTILTNEKYIGRWNYRKTTYSVDPDTGRKVQKDRSRAEWVETIREELRIVPQDTWDRVQAKIEENKRLRRTALNPKGRFFSNRSSLDNRYLLSGAMVCAECGMAVVIVSGRRDGYYGCYGAHRQGVCSCKYLLRRRVAEEAFTGYLQERLVDDTAVVEECADQFNRIIKRIQKSAPSRRNELEGCLREIESEIASLVEFIVKGKAGDLVTVSTALREREMRKAAMTQELATLAAAAEPKILVTPHLIRQGLQRMIQKMIDKSERYNEAARAILEGPLKVSREGKNLFLRGTLNLGAALGGSIHREMASPLSRCLNLQVLPILDEINIEIIQGIG